MPGKPVSSQLTTIQSTEASQEGTAAEPEPGEATEPEATDPGGGESGTRGTPPAPSSTTAGKPGAPGSPIRYDPSRLAQGPEEKKRTIEAQLEEQCGPSRCHIKVVTKLRGSTGCISEISPNPVDRGGTVIIYHGPQCPGDGTTGSGTVDPGGPSTKTTTTTTTTTTVTKTSAGR
ncbi:hypothetical protein AB0I91_25170 [Actinosynnema sp. NPDC049800]